MSENDAVTLLHRKLPDDYAAGTGSFELVKELEYLPLAIIQAAAYVALQQPTVSIQGYLDYYRQKERHRLELLSNDEGDLTTDSEASHAVLTTWEISFEQIKRQSSPSSELLSLIYVFDRHRIPLSFLKKNLSDWEFQRTLKPLIEFSLVNMNEGAKGLEMHGLIQLASRRWLAKRGELTDWVRQALFSIRVCKLS